MTVQEFQAGKREIMKLLWRKGDPAPVCNVLPGWLDERAGLMAVSEYLENNKDCRLVRGFRLIVFINAADTFSYAARSEAVVRTPSGEIKSFIKHRRGDPSMRFIFIASSRMHPDLSDANLLSGFFHLTTVIGGSASIVHASVRTIPLLFSSTIVQIP